MNTKLKFALIHRYSEKGFAMPIAIGMGLIMILIAATLMMRSHADQTTASAQKATARSLGTSETGVTRVQSLLNRYGILASTTLTDISTTPPSSSWKLEYQNSTPSTCSAGAGATEIEGYRLNQWINLDSESKFKVTEYTYRPNKFVLAQITDTTVTIPASGSITLTISPADYLADATSVNGQIQDIQGTLSRSGTTYTFTRLASGTATTVTDKNFIAALGAQVTGSVTIPASGSVTLTISPNAYLANGTSINGQIQGIQGTLSRSGTTYTFTRLASGTATTVTDKNFIDDPGAQVTGGVTIPASGSVTLTISPNTYLADGSSVDGQIEGIQGTLSRTGAIYTFTRLIDGTATATTGKFFPTTTPGTGTLKLEGQVGTNFSATSDLQVNISVQAGDISSVPVPGLWLNSGGMSGGQKVQGNILLNDCSISASSTTYQDIDRATNKPYIDPDTNQPYQTKQTSVNFPALPTKPATIPNTLTLNSHTNITLPDTVNHTFSTKNGQTVYEYSVAEIPRGANITITAGQKVIFYLDGNIEKGADVTHNCGTVASCKATDFQIFGYNSTGSPYLCFNGNNHIDAFIFAPKYSAGVAGGGHSGGFYGSLWVNDFTNAPSCSSSSSHTVVFQSANWAALGLTPKNLPPKISSITSWQRQEAP